MSNRIPALNRRRFVQATAAGAAAGPLVTRSALAGTPQTRTQRLAAQDATQVRALMWTNGPIIDGHFEDRVAAFNEAHAGEIEVSLEFLPYDQYWQKLQLAYASGDIYDVYFWDVQAYGHYKRDLILNLQPMIDEAGALDAAEYPVDLFEPWRLDGENLYAMPENFQTCALYFNRDLFDAEGLEYPDDTWNYDQIVEAATALTKRDGDRVNQWGMNLGNLAIWWGMQTISWAKGTAFFDKVLEPTTFQFSEPENVETLDFVRSLVNDHQVAPKPSVAEQSSDITGFASGRVGLVIDGSWSISGFAELPFQWGVAPIPMWEGNRVVPYWMGGWVIAKDSEVAEAAFEWARWSGNEYQDQMAAEHDWIPVKTSARDSDVTTQDMPEGYRQVIDALADAQIGDVYSDNTQQIWVEVFDPNITQLLEENLDAAEVAARMDEEANALLEG
ncbi:MAG TPA: sugar ABC transporter substrate-binding protein [Thermomicrobiales bacterium]|nr:sugar ABC transporter substrate-binding protein [Thermomicrobiales bacterium]